MTVPRTSEVPLTSTPTHASGPRPSVPAARRHDPPPGGSRGPRVRAPRRPDLLVGLTAFCAGLAVFGYRLGAPSPWRDEAVTVAVASRSTSQILDLVGHVDLVHAPFYLLVHLLFGDSVTAVQARAVSAVAAAATAPVLHGLARRLALPAVGPATARWAGVATAGVWLATPFVSRYAQEARPYALAALVATVSTYLLVRGEGCGDDGDERARRRWLAGYAVSLPLLVSMNTVALLVGVAHAAWVLTRPRRGAPALAAGAGLLLAAPLVLAQHAQAEQVAFLRRPTLAELSGHVEFALGSTAGVVVAALAVALAAWRSPARRAVLLAACWGVLPVPLLWALSQVTPFWTTRYLVFVAPGTCLLVGLAATAALPRVPGLARRGAAVLAVVLVAATALAGLRMQGVFRDARIGHAEDLRGTAALIGEHARPGDGLLFLPDGEYRYRVLTQLYPQDFADLDDLALTRTARDSATLVGETVPADGVAAAVGTTPRVWVVGGPGPVVTASPADTATARLLATDYRLVAEEELRAFSVRLYERR